MNVLTNLRVTAARCYYAHQILTKHPLKALSSKYISTTSSYCHEEITLTKDRYKLTRRDFAAVSEDDLQYFRSVLGADGVLTDDLEACNTDWLKTVRGESRVLLRPQSTDQVSRVVAHCNQRRLAICPQGGNTGLVGGSVPVFDEVIISTALLNKVDHIDPVAGTVVCGAGCVLQALDQALEEHGLMVPLDLGAKGSCHIGGNVSTNAGGLRLVRYGSLHGSVLGLEVVLASGEVLDCLGTLRKDNTGYHLHHMFVGAEGTLGLVTKVSLVCPHRPQSVQLAMLSVDSFNTALQVCHKAKRELGEILSSCEFLDTQAMECVEQNLKLTNPLQASPFYVLVETSGSHSGHDEAKVSEFLESLMTSVAGVSDGTMATEPSRVHKLWQIRERCPEATLVEGYCYWYDISLPLENFYKLVEMSREHLGDRVIRCVGYGHLGDGNLHLNVTAKSYDPETEQLLEPWIYEQTSKLRGSVSAEHGLGFKKRNCAHYSKTATAVRLMTDLKRMMDPNGIMNPYKVLPDHQ